MSEPRLLVTFALFTYNQEAYVAEAVEGALSQDYSPLEIIISDDASTDRTFDIVREMVDRYRGPHQVKATRNTTNLGIGAHLTKVANSARGALIVAAAGDDVSLPGRASAMASLWEQHHRRPDLLCCDASMIGLRAESLCNRKGCPGTKLSALEIARDGKVVLGAVATWTKRLWTLYPELPLGCVSEDQVLSLRAAMAGGIVRQPKTLVRYRVGCGISHLASSTEMGPLLDHCKWRSREVLASLAFQVEDARRTKRMDVIAQLLARRSVMEFIDALYRQERLPHLWAWRVAADARFFRSISAAIVQTRFPQIYRRTSTARAWLNRMTAWRGDTGSMSRCNASVRRRPSAREDYPIDPKQPGSPP